MHQSVSSDQIKDRPGRQGTKTSPTVPFICVLKDLHPSNSFPIFSPLVPYHLATVASLGGGTRHFLPAVRTMLKNNLYTSSFWNGQLSFLVFHLKLDHFGIIWSYLWVPLAFQQTWPRSAEFWQKVNICLPGLGCSAQSGQSG